MLYLVTQRGQANPKMSRRKDQPAVGGGNPLTISERNVPSTPGLPNPQKPRPLKRHLGKRGQSAAVVSPTGCTRAPPHRTHRYREKGGLYSTPEQAKLAQARRSPVPLYNPYAPLAELDSNPNDPDECGSTPKATPRTPLVCKQRHEQLRSNNEAVPPPKPPDSVVTAAPSSIPEHQEDWVTQVFERPF